MFHPVATWQVVSAFATRFLRFEHHEVPGIGENQFAVEPSRPMMFFREPTRSHHCGSLYHFDRFESSTKGGTTSYVNPPSERFLIQPWILEVFVSHQDNLLPQRRFDGSGNETFSSTYIAHKAFQFYPRAGDVIFCGHMSLDGFTTKNNMTTQHWGY